MANVNVTELRLELYAGLMRKVMGIDLGLAMCDEHGAVQWIDDPTKRSNFDWVIKQTRAQDGGWLGEDAANSQRHWVLPGGKVLICQGLDAKLSGPVGYLVTLLEVHGSHSHPGLIVWAKGVLKDIGACVEAEFLLTEELNQMAEELTARYEELNLVYSFEELIKEYDPKDGGAVLRRLVQDCAEFLDVDAVMLVLPEDSIEEIHVTAASAQKLDDPDALLRSIQTEYLPKVRATKTSLVVNSPDPADSESYHTRLRLKVAAIPVLGIHNDVRGLLAIATRPDRPDISTGDRKLLDALTKQVSVVIQSSYDLLTGLLNRQGFETRCEDVLASASGVAQAQTLLIIDIDQFRVINDTCGQAAGDELLKQIAGLIVGNTRDSDLAARLGNDEFAVFLTTRTPESGLQVAEKISQAIKSHRFSWDAKFFDISASIGVSFIDGANRLLPEHLGHAHSACMVAKSSGLGKVYPYRPGDPTFAHHTRQMEWVPRLQSALEENKFRLYGQRILSIDGQDPLPRLETLLRLEDPPGQLVTPFTFIPAAERFQLMTRIDRWVVHNAMRALSKAFAGREGTLLSCSINLSGQSLTEEGLLEFILTEQQAAGIPASNICFEITETAAIACFSAARRFIEELAGFGFRFSLDDFGSGLSSFSYLNNLPVNYLKIDGALVKQIVDSAVHATMVESVGRIGHAMDIKTIAEFVENDAILAKLGEMEIDYAQGYGIGKPVPIEGLLQQLIPALPIAAAGAG